MKKITLLFFTLLATTFVNAQNVSGVFANNGSVNIVELNNDATGAAIRVSGNHTIEAWVKAPSTERGYVMCMGTLNSFSGTYRIEANTLGKAIVAFVGVAVAPQTTYFNVITTSNVFDGTWHHIAVVGTTTSGTTSTKIYVDGVLDATTVPNYTRPTSWVSTAGAPGTMVYSTVGGRSTNIVSTDVLFNGEIDEARFWTVARTEAQIQNESCVIVDATGLYRNIKLDNNILDSSVNAKATTVIGAGVSSYGTANCAPIWDGSSSSSWTEAANWRLNALPNQNSDVTIATAATQPIINSDVSVKSLTLNPSTSLTVNSGFNFTVADAISNSGTMTLENNSNLIQGGTTNTNTGNITVKRNSNALFRSDYTIWSSPVTNASSFLKDFSPITLDTRFYNYKEDTNLYSTAVGPASTPFALAAGYLIRMPNNGTANYEAGTETLTYSGEFTGVPNNGTITKAVTYNGSVPFGYNMVGNPYPSTIDADLFIDANSANIETGLYFWRKKNAAIGSAYAIYNPLGGTTVAATAPSSDVPNGIIQVGQGFFVKAKSASDVTFTNAMRVANNDNQFFKTKAVQKDRLWLNLTTASGVFSQALIGYTDAASQGLDFYDAKYFNDSPIALTSNINNEEYSIQGRPTFDPSDMVALNFKTDVAGDYTIALDHFDGVFAAGQDIFLKDNTTGTETNLKNSSYTFNAASGTDNARFSLTFQKTLKVGAPAFNENSVSVYNNNGTLYVNSGLVAISNISVFDFQGRLISEQRNVKATTAAIKDVRSNQVLIVKIVGEDNAEVTKKVVN